jgi:prepilin-type N-terminal cleavage/methylation domain-containing protein
VTRLAGRATGRSGFTLAELIVVLVILSVVAATVMPALRTETADALSVAANEVSQLLLCAERTALESGAFVRLTLNPTTRAYVVEQVSDTAISVLGGGSLDLPPGVAFSEERPSIRFEFGRTGAVAQDSLVLRAGAASRVIRVDAWSGSPLGDAR